MANVRLTQIAVEVIGPSPTVRETQQVRETLTGPGSPNVRETQQVRETLTGPGNPNIRETQQVREVLANVSSNARVTQEAKEILQGPGNPNAKLTQEAKEILANVNPPPVNARLTQEAKEILQGPGNPNARLTQEAKEILANLAPPATNARLTQQAKEILARHITAAPPLTLSCPSATTGVPGTAYSSSFSATGGTPGYSYSISSGALPLGLTLSPASGIVSGTPTTSGTYSFTGKVTDSVGTMQTSSCSIVIAAVPPILIQPKGCSGSNYVPMGTLISEPAQTSTPKSGPTSWTDIWPNQISDPSTYGSLNDCGPFYHGGYVWFIYSVSTSGAVLKASRSLNGESWSVVTTSPAYSTFSPNILSMCEYQSGSIHQVFILVGRPDLGSGSGLASDSNGNQIYYTNLWSFDFNTTTFTQLTTSDTLAFALLNNSITGVGVTTRIPDPPNGFANCSVLRNNPLIRCDPNTGNVYLFCLGSPTGYVCPFSSSTTNYYLFPGYYIWNGTSWSSFNPAYSNSSSHLAVICQAYIDNSSNIYAVIASVLLQADSGSCNVYLANGTTVAFFVFKNSTNVGPISTYVFNNPGCPPYNEPNLVRSAIWSAGAPSFPGTFGAYPFPTSSSFQFVSKFHQVGSNVYFATMDTNRNAILYQISGAAMNTFPIASNVSIWHYTNPPTFITYNNHIELMVVSGQIIAMWVTEDYLPTAHQKGNWTTLNWYHYPDTGCSSSATYSGSNFDTPSVNWAIFSGTSWGAITKIDCTGVIMNPSVGLMPYQVPASGTWYNAGDLTFAITYRGVNAALSTPFGPVSGGPGPSPPTISCPTTTSGTVNVAFSSSLSASGGTPPYTFSITSGALPPGLTLNSSTGLISGTPTTAGTFSFTAQVTDSTPLTGTVTCSITIGAPPPPNFLPARPCP